MSSRDFPRAGGVISAKFAVLLLAATFCCQTLLSFPLVIAWIPQSANRPCPSNSPRRACSSRAKICCGSGVSTALSSSSGDDVLLVDNDDGKEESMGLNELQTLLREAVRTEDFLLAKKYRDILADRVSSGAYRPTGDASVDRRKMRRLSWRGLGTARWLEDRLDALSYKFPTTIQINAFEAINTMLGALEDDSAEKETLEELIERRAGPGAPENMGVVISGSTGSGKTLAYLVPTLSTLSDSLFTRQRIRVKAEEDVGDVADDLLARVAVQTSPTIRGQGRRQVGGGGGNGALATGATMSTLGKSGTDVRSPLALIVVPTRELGVQTALLLYECVGGSTKKTMTELPGLANSFKYKGPKGVKIGCVLDDEEAKFGLKLQTDVAITTPTYIAKLIRDGDVVPENLRVIVYDEADLALEQTLEEDLGALFSNSESERSLSRLTYLVGASVTESLGKLVVKDGILLEDKSFIATATKFAPLTTADISEDASTDTKGSSDDGMASLKDLGLCLDPGLKHERLIVPGDRGMLCLVRLLRQELQEYDQAVICGRNSTMVQRPRVVVFFPGEEEAKAATGLLRDALWGDHKLCVLLPNIGINPLEIMEQFKSNQTSIMLATPNAVRGLDFANLTHVFTSYLPADDPREYLHLAGRVGRIGQMGSVSGMGGRVTSIIRPEEADQMETLAQELGFDFTDLDYVEADTVRRDADEEETEEDVEKSRRYLEDTITLLDLTDDRVVDMDEVEKSRTSTDFDDIDEDEENIDDEV